LARIQLGKIGSIKEAIISKSDLVLDQIVSRALENGSSELSSLWSKLCVHLVSISQEILRVPELRHNFGVDIHLFKSGLALSF
jgi:hypothetical protein